MPKAKASLLMLLTTALTVTVLFLMPFVPKIAVRSAVVQEGTVVRTTLLTGAVAYQQQQLCLSPASGVIRRVYVHAGETVQKGDLLFSLDTTAQENALAALYRQQHALSHVVSANGASAALAGNSALAQQEWQLRAAIQAAQIRAGANGVVETLYAQEGMPVSIGALLGNIRGSEKCIVVADGGSEAAGLSNGAAAALTIRGADAGPVWLSSCTVPALDNSAERLLTFLPQSQEQLSGLRIGERVMVEAVLETIPGCVPIPAAAVDAQNQVWFIQDGRAEKEQLETSRRSAEAVAAPLEWAGRSVILLPDAAKLTEGCAVKEEGLP